MSLDLYLLQNSASKSSLSPIIRFYTWEKSWLSLGHNQKNIPEKWWELVNKKKLNIVKRPSGGSAVLHSGGLTYALIWPSPPRKKLEAYYQASQFLIKGFSDLGIPLQFGNQPISLNKEDCFATSTSADLIDKEGEKRIGSAQLWHRGYLLQHGEILIAPPKKLWIEVFGTPPPKPLKSSISRTKLENCLLQTFKGFWPHLSWEELN